MLGLVHELGQLFEARPELIGDVAPNLNGGFGIGLNEGLADSRRDDGMLALANMGQGIAHKMHAAALPAGADHTRDGGFQTLMCVGDDELDAFQPAFDEGLQKARPEGLGL
jgi:hypothetical protein